MQAGKNVGCVFFCFRSQVVILARVITDSDQVSLTAKGIACLVKILTSTNDEAVIMAGK